MPSSRYVWIIAAFLLAGVLCLAGVPAAYAQVGPAAAPPEPTNVSASDGTLYKLFRGASPEGVQLRVADTNGTAYEDTPPAAGVTYCYWVTACNSHGCGDYSRHNPGYAARGAVLRAYLPALNR